MRSCKYCHHTECNRCRMEQTKGKAGICCQCHRIGFPHVRTKAGATT